MAAIILRIIDQARAFAKQNRIECEDDYLAVGLWPWPVYERFKRRLASELDPASEGWAPACRALAEALKI